MNATYDLIIRGGTVVDGSGGEPIAADVGIVGGLIRDVGDISGSAASEIDATGNIVTPGFVDIHTHYDGQVSWSHSIGSSSYHGVTTVVMGNCGVGFAPCRPSERDLLVQVMEGVEDIPEIVMTEGIPWQWETFPEYLDFVGSRSYDIDCAAYVPHAPIRVYVMRKRATTGEPPTADDLSRMRQIVADSVRAGAIGVSTSRTLLHRDSTGAAAPHVRSDLDELLALASGLHDGGGGTFELVPRLLDEMLADHISGAEEFDLGPAIEREAEILKAIATTSQGLVTYALVDNKDFPDLHRLTLATMARLNDEGLQVKAQTLPRPLGLLVGLDLSLHPFRYHPSYLTIQHLPLEERTAAMRTDEMRRRLLSEFPDREQAGPTMQMLCSRALNSFRLGDPPDYTLREDASLIAEASRSDISPWALALDWLLEQDGKNVLLAPVSNFNGTELESVSEMLAHRDTLIGLGDGGAHYGLACDASYPTMMLSYWARDRKTDSIPLATVVHYLSRRNAKAFGFTDRGLVAPGMKADLNVIDFDKLRLEKPEARYDLPANGRRVIQHATGYLATVVSGEIIRRDDQPTGATPGRLVRSHRPTGP